MGRSLPDTACLGEGPFKLKVPQHSTTKARLFAELTRKGKVEAAARLFTEEKHASMLPLDQVIGGKSVHEILREKHPLTHSDTLPTPLVANPIPIHPEIFAAINGLAILSQH